MAVYADWAKVLNWIYLILFSYVGDLFKTMNLNVIFPNLAEELCKIKTAHVAIITIMF